MLVGTFLGILLGYGFVGPMASAMEARAEQDSRIYESVKESETEFRQWRS